MARGQPVVVAEAVAFDVLFPDLRTDHPKVEEAGTLQTSDQSFANELARAGNVVLAAERGVVPENLFRTNALAIGDISARKARIFGWLATSILCFSHSQ